MAFVKGMKRHPNAGRKKGDKNTKTQAAREQIGNFIETTVQDYAKWLKSVDDPKERCNLWLKTVEFHIPRLVRSEVIEKPASVDELSDAELDKLIASYQAKIGIIPTDKPVH